MRTKRTQPLVHLEKVRRTFGHGATSVHAVRGIDLTIFAGQFVVLMGPSGSGKTTLLNLIGGLDFPTAGRVFYAGRDMRSFSRRQMIHWRRHEVGFIFQTFGLLPALTALENVELGLHIAGVPFAKRRKEATRRLQSLGLGQRVHQSVSQLSGGEQQRVAIARALAHRPNLVLADEPTGELDVKSSRNVLALLRRLVDAKDMTVCLVTHDPLVRRFADITYFLHDGRIVQRDADIVAST